MANLDKKKNKRKEKHETFILLISGNTESSEQGIKRSNLS